MTLRQRNRLAGMRHIQQVALELMEPRGFDAVTLQDVAAAAGVSPSTVYRYFETKERVVLWDEHDAPIGAQLASRLRSQPPAVAFRDAFLAALDERGDAAGLLRRVRFIYATPQVHAAAVEQEFRDRDALARGFEQVLAPASGSRALTADVLAGCCMAALDAALDHWQRADGASDIHELVHAAFAPLTDA
jgi:AcrR family transcriptional regulator